MVRFFLIVVSFAFAAPAFPEPSMNGYTLKQFKDFENTWKLVTVRFRNDTGEMRLTYANPLAWDALQKNQTDYPDGAIFAKIGLATSPDPAFASSSVPSGSRRYQFMVRDHAKHKDTDGWGYALFLGEGELTREDPKTTTAACLACHRIIPERGQVFSQPMHLRTSENLFGAEKDRIAFLDGSKKTGRLETRLTFVTASKAKLPKAALKELPSSIREVRYLQGALRKNIFSGTINEIRPELSREAVRSGLPAALVSEDGKDFAVIFKDPQRESCALPNGKLGVFLTALSSSKGENSKVVAKLAYCESPL